MFDVALSSAGAQLVLATSHDDKHRPEHIIDGKSETFWMSTGMFPQEFVISFTAVMNIKSVTINSYNVRNLLLERSVNNEPSDFQPIQEKEFEFVDCQLQEEEFSLANTTAMHLRFVIQSGYDHFVSVQKVHVNGNAEHI